MRAQFAKRFPNVLVHEDDAQNMKSIANATFDAVFIAQAFHWFANIEALRELRRVLKPNGTLVLIWNIEDGANWYVLMF